MTLLKDWTKNDNFKEMSKAHKHRRNFLRAFNKLPIIALFDARKKQVGAGWERIKQNLTVEEIEAVQNATKEDWKTARDILK